MKKTTKKVVPKEHNVCQYLYEHTLLGLQYFMIGMGDRELDELLVWLTTYIKNLRNSRKAKEDDDGLFNE